MIHASITIAQIDDHHHLIFDHFWITHPPKI